MNGILSIAHVTWLEARRRRIVLAAILGGLLFLLVFAAAVYAANRGAHESATINVVQQRTIAVVLTLAGLYVVNFLSIAVAILLPVDTLAGEIGSGVMQTLASKPIRRSDIVVGKWLTYWLMTGAYLLLMVGGIVLTMRLFASFEQVNLIRAVPLMLLSATIMLTISLAGGVRFTTVTNGMVAFALYGIAFIGGWIEQIGALGRSEAALSVGTAISLASPSDAMWRLAAHELQPPIMQELPLGPFSSAAVPSSAMVIWAIGFVLVALLVALHQFQRRPL